MAGEEAEGLHPEGRPRRSRLDAGAAQQSHPVLRVALLGVGELEEHGLALLVGVLGEAAVQRATSELVGPHLPDALQPLCVGRGRHDTNLFVRAQ